MKWLFFLKVETDGESYRTVVERVVSVSLQSRLCHFDSVTGSDPNQTSWHVERWYHPPAWQCQGHRAIKTQKLLQQFKRNFGSSSLNSPEIGTSDYFLLPILKEQVSGTRLPSYSDCENNCQELPQCAGTWFLLNHVKQVDPTF